MWWSGLEEEALVVVELDDMWMDEEGKSAAQVGGI